MSELRKRPTAGQKTENSTSPEVANGTRQPQPTSTNRQSTLSWLVFASDVVVSLIFFCQVRPSQLAFSTFSLLVTKCFIQIFEQWPTIWYIPMNNMEFSFSYEFFILTLFLPVLLGIGPLRRFITRQPIVGLLALVGVSSYLAPTLSISITILSIGVGLTALLQFNSIYSDERRRERTVWSMLLALVVLLGMRLAFSTVIPIFRYTEVNIATLVIGAAV